MCFFNHQSPHINLYTERSKSLPSLLAPTLPYGRGLYFDFDSFAMLFSTLLYYSQIILNAHNADIKALCLSPSGRYLFSTGKPICVVGSKTADIFFLLGDNEAMCIWDTKYKMKLAEFVLSPKATVTSECWASSNVLLLGFSNSSLRVYQINECTEVVRSYSRHIHHLLLTYFFSVMRHVLWFPWVWPPIQDLSPASILNTADA